MVDSLVPFYLVVILCYTGYFGKSVAVLPSAVSSSSDLARGAEDGFGVCELSHSPRLKLVGGSWLRLERAVLDVSAVAVVRALLAFGTGAG